MVEGEPRAPGPDERELLPRDTRFAERYRIEELLGRGGMGIVYRAHDLSLDEPVALKVLRPSRRKSMETRVARLKQEVRLARKVTHPNVVRVHDVGERDGAVYFTMELVDGGTLRSLLRAEPRLPLPRAAAIARALCEGLAAIHGADIVHGDLKPANVLLDRAGRVVISDFGIAREGSGAAEIAGSPGYMAPEQMVGETLDVRTDIYALGLIIVEMLTGLRREGIVVDPEDDDPLPADLPEAAASLAAFGRRCAAWVPDARPASVAEVLEVVSSTAAAPIEDGAGAIAISMATNADSAIGARAPRPSANSRKVAVLPFAYEGPTETAYLGDAIAAELVHDFERVRGVRVIALSAVSALRSAAAQALHHALGVDVVVQGAARVAGDRAEISFELIDAPRGVVLRADRHEMHRAELLAAQATMTQRIAETLRVDLEVLRHGAGMPSEAIEQYLLGRSLLRDVNPNVTERAMVALDRVLSVSPGFAPAAAAHAVAAVRTWNVRMGGGIHDIELDAPASVARAERDAPDLADTHLAVAMLATQRADYARAAQALARALHVAPTYAAAHEYLGVLQCEAGQTEEGVWRLRYADTLDPALPLCPVFIARDHALNGRHEACDATLLEAERRRSGPQPGFRVMRARMALWRGDRGALEAIAEDPDVLMSSRHASMALAARVLLGRADMHVLDEVVSKRVKQVSNPRMIAMLSQLATEVYAAAGRPDAAWQHLARAADIALVDIEWLRRCPVLAPLRARPEFAEIARRVGARAAALWRA